MENTEQFKEFMKQEGYYTTRILEDGRWIGLYPFIFTVAIVQGNMRDYQTGYDRRWCYHDSEAAIIALSEWQDRGFKDKPLNYITEK